jgi:hypothetical protein
LDAGLSSGAAVGEVRSSTSIEGSAAAAPALGGTIDNRILGVLGGAMLLAALMLFVTGVGDIGQGAVEGAGPPRLGLVDPADGAVVTGRLRLVFRVERERLTSMPTGWGVGGHHVHAEINGQELMPAASDISRQAGESYIWMLPELPLGDVSVRLIWSDSRHRPVKGGSSDQISVRLE